MSYNMHKKLNELYENNDKFIENFKTILLPDSFAAYPAADGGTKRK